jgi:hypothetical protein
MNILIVESENDQYFVQALSNYLNNADTTVCTIDDYKHSSLDKTKLKIQIGSALTTKQILKVGVILDMDDSNAADRIQLVNECLENALKENFSDFEVTKLLQQTNQFIDIKIDEYSTIQFACYFTNVDGNGELETLLKAMKTKDSTFADCLLDGWQTCIEHKGKKVAKRGESGDITDKELLKLWVDFYKRFDTLKKGNRNKDSTDWKGIFLGISNKQGKILARGNDIFSFDAPVLDDLKLFLRLFN